LGRAVSTDVALLAPTQLTVTPNGLADLTGSGGTALLNSDLPGLPVGGRTHQPGYVDPVLLVTKAPGLGAGHDDTAVMTQPPVPPRALDTAFADLAAGDAWNLLPAFQ